MAEAGQNRTQELISQLNVDPVRLHPGTSGFQTLMDVGELAGNQFNRTDRPGLGENLQALTDPAGVLQEIARRLIPRGGNSFSTFGLNNTFGGGTSSALPPTDASRSFVGEGGGSGTGGGGGLFGNFDFGDTSQGFVEPPDLSGFDNVGGALKDYAKLLQSQLPGTLETLDAEAGLTRTGIQNERTRREDLLDLNRSREQERTRSAISEARRNAAELLTGLQARFGATTGTGGFAGELLGRETMSNIAQNRASEADALRQIRTAEIDLERQTSQMINELDTKLQIAKQDARRQLDLNLAEINNNRESLEFDKQKAKVDTLKEYAQINAQIDANNTAFKQDLFLRFEDQKAKLNTLKSTADPNIMAVLQAIGLDPASFISGGTDTSASNVRQNQFDEDLYSTEF